MFDPPVPKQRGQKSSASPWTEEEREIVLDLAGAKLAREIADELLDK